jgi:ubiquinone/menaquinone biosynthesis C-methylase UbiE
MNNKADKKYFYSQKDVVDNYENLRFSCKGGEYVHTQEINTINGFISSYIRGGKILDIPVGTGRVIRSLDRSQFGEVYAADYSPVMLEYCLHYLQGEVDLSQQDIYNTTFDDAYFDLIICSRFFFHSDSQSSVIQELKRILKPNGHIIFDTLNWSPRSCCSLFQYKLGGAIYPTSHSILKDQLNHHGFSVIDHQNLFFLPTFFYRFIPDFISGIIIALDQYVPKRMMTKTVWIVKNDA